MAEKISKILIIIAAATVLISGCTDIQDDLKDKTDTISDGAGTAPGQIQNAGDNPSGAVSTPVQTGQNKEMLSGAIKDSEKNIPAISGPTSSIVAVNDLETAVADIKVTHMGGDTLKGGEWKISLVPIGNSSAFLTPPADSDFSIGKTISFIFTTESMTGERDAQPIFLEPGSRYKIELVSIPSGAVLIDQIIDVTGEPPEFATGSSQVSAPTASVVAANNPDTPGADVKISHKGGDTLKGGEWKLSIVPLGASPAFITSTQGSDFGIADIIAASTTTEGATDVSDSGLTGGVQLLANGARYDVKMVHIPTNAMMLDQVIEVR